jgi:MoaA/NifB/PqqE/SkfB family radical SAM enzyme
VRISRLRTAFLMGRGAVNFVLRRPYCVSFEVTHCCNAHCKHCHRGGAVEETRAASDVYGDLCRELRPVVAEVSGGEPLLRGDLEQVIEALRTPNGAPYIVVTTNAALLSEERFFSLRQAGVDEFSISLDYPDERHDDFRGIAGLFRRIESFIGSLSSPERGTITLSCVVQSDNFRDLIGIAELARAWHVKLNFSTYTHLRTHDQDYLLSTEESDELEDIISHLVGAEGKYGVMHTSDYVFDRMLRFFRDGYLPDCRAGTRFFNVNPSGTFSPCGLFTADYKSQKELNDRFSRNNNCGHCYTSIRASCEKPLKYLFTDSMRSI